METGKVAGQADVAFFESFKGKDPIIKEGKPVTVAGVKLDGFSGHTLSLEAPLTVTQLFTMHDGTLYGALTGPNFVLAPTAGGVWDGGSMDHVTAIVNCKNLSPLIVGGKIGATPPQLSASTLRTPTIGCTVRLEGVLQLNNATIDNAGNFTVDQDSVLRTPAGSNAGSSLFINENKYGSVGIGATGGGVGYGDFSATAVFTNITFKNLGTVAIWNKSILLLNSLLTGPPP